MYTDVASLNMLASATKGLQTLQELAKDFGVVAKNYQGGNRNRAMMENLMMNQQMDFWTRKSINHILNLKGSFKKYGRM